MCTCIALYIYYIYIHSILKYTCIHSYICGALKTDQQNGCPVAPRSCFWRIVDPCQLDARSLGEELKGSRYTKYQHIVRWRLVRSMLRYLMDSNLLSCYSEILCVAQWFTERWRGYGYQLVLRNREGKGSYQECPNHRIVCLNLSENWIEVVMYFRIGAKYTEPNAEYVRDEHPLPAFLFGLTQI